ncbi:hypothetical protein WA026_000325 [Henosepilachna vigintioctopunctata]|uniref:Uncharacterized protein n=1 Tax=Henosepilachna vigintioctopunctata TaxID=420089 RepID=A0AAW1UY53_9CUCU
MPSEFSLIKRYFPENPPQEGDNLQALNPPRRNVGLSEVTNNFFVDLGLNVGPEDAQFPDRAVGEFPKCRHYAVYNCLNRVRKVGRKMGISVVNAS